MNEFANSLWEKSKFLPVFCPNGVKAFASWYSIYMRQTNAPQICFHHNGNVLERERERLTVPATDFDDMKVFALNLDKPKSHT
jgi:hypothetical protein